MRAVAISISISISIVVCACAKGELEASRREIAKLTVEKYASEAFPRWAVQNPGTACPDLAALDQVLGRKGEPDPWGSPYVLLCGDASPVTGVGVMSLGPDRERGTDDDITSWQSLK
jgi:hypothetical protein